MLDNGYSELAITSAHAVFVESLPPSHKDPFDRILVAQANVEGITLVTGDSTVEDMTAPALHLHQLKGKKSDYYLDYH